MLYYGLSRAGGTQYRMLGKCISIHIFLFLEFNFKTPKCKLSRIFFWFIFILEFVDILDHMWIRFLEFVNLVDNFSWRFLCWFLGRVLWRFRWRFLSKPLTQRTFSINLLLDTKVQIISELLFDVLNFPKNQCKNLTNFWPRI